MHWSSSAGKSRDSRNLYVLLIVLQGPLAVFLLAFQLFIIPRQVWPVVTEVIVLLLAVLSSFMNFGKAHGKWTRARIRAELLKREAFLYSARVGPYLSCSRADLPIVVNQRLAALTDEGFEPLDLMDEATDGVTWRDALENRAMDQLTGSVASVSSADLSDDDLASTYLEHRVRYQREYFQDSGTKHERYSGIYEKGASLALVLAFAVAVFHLGHVVQETGDDSKLSKVLEVLGLGLPTLGAAFMGLRTYFETHRIAHSYLDVALLLGGLENAFLELQKTNPTATIRDRSLQIKRLILRTEDVLSAETRRWWFIVEPEKPEGGI